MTVWIWRCSGVSVRRKVRAPRRDAPRKAGFTHGLRHVAASARGRIAARVDLVADALGDHVRLTRQLRLVDLHAALGELPVHHDLVARFHGHEVAYHQLLGSHRALHAVADHPGRRPGQQRDLVQRLLGADLLVDADRDVGADDPDGDEGIEGSAHHDECEAEQEQHVVDEGEDVLADDGGVGSRRRWRRRVAQSLLVAGGRLGLGQAGGRGRSEVRGGLRHGPARQGRDSAAARRRLRWCRCPRARVRWRHHATSRGRRPESARSRRRRATARR